jgi:hypothetical protein
VRLARLPLAALAPLVAAACSLTVEGDTDPTYGEVTLSVTGYDQRGVELSRDVRTGAGADLVGPLDRDLVDAILVDGEEVTDPSGLLDAREARIGDVVLTREWDADLRASGETILAVRSARRSGAALSVEVDRGRFEIAVAGQLSAASTDRILATALVRIVRGEALLADDCRPDCLYSLALPGFLCAPIRDQMVEVLGGECAGPFTADEWAAVVQGIRDRKRDTCYDLWLIPRPICEWAYDLSVDNVLPYLAPDAEGRVCASTLYGRCTGAE